VTFAGFGVQGSGFRVLVLSSAFSVLSSPLLAQGRISNAKTETRSAAQGLEREVRAASARGGVTWIGYRMPMVAGPRQMCCFDTVSDTSFSGGMCRLESGGGVSMSSGDMRDRNGSRITLEPATEFLVFARLEGGSVTRVRTFTPDCDIDATAMPLVWLNDVKPDESVAWLASLVKASPDAGDRHDRVGNTAMAALALHDVPSALTTLIATAREGTSANVRGKALFWLAQRAGQRAIATITGAIDNDPDTEVKKRAVFALSQLPKDEGVPKLMEVARNNRNPQVRKQAMFWLGESKDPRAVKFFEEILTRK
jgi:hypothetical protein